MTEPEPPRASRGILDYLARGVLILVGIVLLAPGLCAVAFMINVRGVDVLMLGLWLVCFLISWGGIMLIRTALTR